MSFWQQSKNSPAVARMSWSTSWPIRRGYDIIDQWEAMYHTCPHCITMWLFLALSVASPGGLASIAALRSLSLYFIYRGWWHVTWCSWLRAGTRRGQSAHCETSLPGEGSLQAGRHMRQEETYHVETKNLHISKHLILLTCDKACWQIQMQVFVGCYKCRHNSCICCPCRMAPASCTSPLLYRVKRLRLSESEFKSVQSTCWQSMFLSKLNLQSQVRDPLYVLI